jgi:adenylate cyclase
MIAGGEVRGLIFAEAEERLAFSPAVTQAVELVAAQLGSLAALSEAEADPDPTIASPSKPPGRKGIGKTILKIEYHAYDDSVFINHDYIIKGVPGRLLWRMLGQHVRDGRTEFTNREFRLDPAMKLPDFKDNLETRLLLLDRRLAEKACPVQIRRVGRGRLALVVVGHPVLVELA